mgnify:CR=1 FL=1
MSHPDDRWQMGWLPVALKNEVLGLFHDLDARTSIDLYSALGATPDHTLAFMLGVSTMDVLRLRLSLGISLSSSSGDVVALFGESGPTEIPWPPDAPSPARRTCRSCSHWGLDQDPDYDECRLSGDELLQANSWFVLAGGREGNPPQAQTTGCPHWSQAL